MAKYSIGLDFGTLSVRGLLVDIATGQIAARTEYSYPHKIMKTLDDGTTLPSDAAYAHPSDYIDGMKTVITALVKEKGEGEIISLGLDATSCSVIALSQNGAPMCLSPEWKDHPNAYIKLWKHHTTRTYAERLQTVAAQRGERFLSDCGNTVNAESFFPKVLETFEQDRDLYNATALFMDVGEWLTLVLTGKLIQSEALACFKRFYHPFRGYPAKEYFEAVAPEFGSVLSKLRGKMLSVGAQAGEIHPRTAEALGLPEGIIVSVPQIDAHTAMAAVGGKAGDMVNVMGTSGVCLLCSHSDSGMDGIYSSSAHCFLPDAYGHEGGQSSLGDSFAWFVNHCVPPEYHDAALEKDISLYDHLSALAANKKAGESGLLALNWLSGVRTPLMDFSLTGSLIGISSHTKPEDIYRALLEAALFSTRQIRDIFKNHGHTISRYFLSGGIPRKNKLFCQLSADILGVDIQACNFEDCCALGSAILAAIAEGSEKQETLLENMRCREIEVYYPDFAARDTYDKLYYEYQRLGSIMGGYDSVLRRVSEVKETI